MKSAHLISLGCSKNLVDSEHILGILKQNGVVYSAAAEGSNYVIINTCGFLQAAIQESTDTIKEMLELKAAGKVDRVVVTGCLTQRFGPELEKQLPEVDLFLGTGNFHKIYPYLQDLESQQGPAAKTYLEDPDFIYSDQTPRMRATMSHTAYVKVSEGCSRTCTFCIIPKLRGDMRSRSVADIVREADQLARAGTREINLIAQDLTSYGRDLNPKADLEALLRELVKVEGLDWIRLHYAYPWGFTAGLIELIRTQPKICPYIDMPLQHIDDALLKSMRRNTTGDSIRNLLKDLRTQIPNLTLRTTLIVGFPGESQDAFNRLADFVRETRFDRLGIFTYSQEPGTPAAEMPDQIDEKIKIHRRNQIMKIQQKVSLENHLKFVGKVVPAIMEHEFSQNNLWVYHGRLNSQAPEVDGKTVVQSTQRLSIGSIYPVKIEGASAYDFYGKHEA